MKHSTGLKANSTQKNMHKVGSLHTVEYCSAIKGCDLRATQRDLGNIMLSGGSQVQRPHGQWFPL